MSTSKYTPNSPRSGKRDVQNIQPPILFPVDRPFITDLRAATSLEVNFCVIYGTLYQALLGYSIHRYIEHFGLDHADPNAWEKIRPLLAQHNKQGFHWLELTEEMIRLRVVNTPINTLSGIHREVAGVALANGHYAATVMAKQHINLATGEHVYEEEDEEECE